MKFPLVILVLAVAVLALIVACSGGEGPAAVEPAAEALPEVTATAAATPTPVEPAAEDILPTLTPPTTAGEMIVDGAVVETYLRSEQGPMVMTTLPTVELPGNVALLAHFAPVEKDGIPTRDLVRVYKPYHTFGLSELVRETLFSLNSREGDCDGPEGYFSVDYDDIQTLTGELPACGGDYLPIVAAPDGSSLVMTVCVEAPCFELFGSWSFGGSPPPRYTSSTDEDVTPGRTVLFESKDGGVTWEKLTDFDLPWAATSVWPTSSYDGQSSPTLVLDAYGPLLQDHDGNYTKWSDPMLWPSGEVLKLPTPPEGYYFSFWSRRTPFYLDDGRIAWGMVGPDEAVTSERTWDLYLTTDGEDVTELVLEQTSSCPRCLPILHPFRYTRLPERPLPQLADREKWRETGDPLVHIRARPDATITEVRSRRADRSRGSGCGIL